MRIMSKYFLALTILLVSCSGNSSSVQETVESSPVLSIAESTSPTQATVNLQYKVGDPGPGGGIIFYADAAGFDNSDGGDTSIGAMCTTGTCNYLEMVPGDGPSGTIEEMPEFVEYFNSTAGNNWLIPSRDALNEMCKFAFSDTKYSICNDNGAFGELTATSFPYEDFGGTSFISFYYWSSSKVGEGIVAQHFGTGYQTVLLKKQQAHLRLVRAFAEK